MGWNKEKVGWWGGWGLPVPYASEPAALEIFLISE